MWERHVILLNDRTRAFREVTWSVTLLIKTKVLGGESRTVVPAQPVEIDFQRHFSNLLEAWGSREGESVCPLIPKNILEDCLLFMPPDTPEERATRSLVIRNLGLLSRSFWGAWKEVRGACSVISSLIHS